MKDLNVGTIAFSVFMASLCISWPNPSRAQLVYSGIKSEEKQVAINDAFDSPSTEWHFGKGAGISDGKLNIKKTDATRFIEIDFSRSFEIETMVQSDYTSGEFKIKLGSYVIYLHAKFKDDRGIKVVNGCRIMLETDGNNNRTGTNIEFANLGTNRFNKYTIRKIGELYYIFINEKLVETYHFPPFNQVGILTRHAGLQVDSFVFSYLSTGDNVAARVQPSAGTAAAASASTTVKPAGKFYALIIGVSDYADDRLDLDKPAGDAQKLRQILISNYTFSDSTVQLLINPTRQNILLSLYHLRKIVSSNDNLLIFYAGHGFWDEAARQGYWWARDASANDPSNWLSNSDLREQIRSITSGHTLLISDACFSGGIFRTRSANSIQDAALDIQILYKLPSRRAITSGTMTTVPDKSVFFEYLVKRLADNQEEFMTSQQLFDSFRQAVINNSMVVPQDGIIAEAGDEGGDFIFIRRKR